jgi:hypothetical protein
MDQDQITLRVATTITTNWRNANPGSVKSFLVPIEDLRGILSDSDAAYARVYLCLDGGMEKIIFVGANGSKQDILPTLNRPDAPNSEIYDFTIPCPPTCDDVTSPLNTGILPA